MTHVQADGKRDVFSPAKAPGKQYSVKIFYNKKQTTPKEHLNHFLD